MTGCDQISKRISVDLGSGSVGVSEVSRQDLFLVAGLVEQVHGL